MGSCFIRLTWILTKSRSLQASATVVVLGYAGILNEVVRYKNLQIRLMQSNFE